MSEEEEQYSEEEVEEEDVEEAAEEPSIEPEATESETGGAVESHEHEHELEGAAKAIEDTQPKLRRVERPGHRESAGEAEITEAEKAMLAQKKRHEEEQAQKAQDDEQRRREELAAVEQELIELKQKQQERKKQREQDEQEFAERRRQDDMRRRQEEEERKSRIEAQKRAKEEEKRKRQQMMAGSFVTTNVSNKQKQRTAEESAEAKRAYMTSVSNKADTSSLLPNDLKAKIKTLYKRIVNLEGEKYDLENRKSRQDYDMKELTERQAQRARNRAVAAGVEVEEADGAVVPPKFNVASKFDRQKDHRDYGQRRDIFESPFEKPTPSIAHGSGRPPAEWGRTSKRNEELETVRKNLEPFKYVELAPVEGDAARPPVEVIPLQVPAE